MKTNPPAQLIDLQSVISTLKTTREHYRQQAAHYTAEADRIETALSVLEQDFSQPPVSTTDRNGAALQSPKDPQESQAVQPSPDILPHPPLSEPSPSSSDQQTSKPKDSDEAFSLKDDLRARYLKLDLNEAITKVLSLAPQPAKISNLVDELYGRNLKRTLRSRATAALTRHMNRSAKLGLWYQVAEEGEPLAFSLEELE